ncbi:MAG: hypothetical protein HEQ27_07845 [Dolichospermum sp. JUN01]|jgi:hypothetical protein|nr:hypothetical protein [Dolichospermum sp. JUN01]QSV54724.1 MAG: hypothetical protein HEP80_13415 [Dolichospermum sp. UKL201]
MLTFILGAAALGIASFGSFAGARSISDIHDLKDQPKIMRDSYEASLTNFQMILKNTQNEAQEYENELKEYEITLERMTPQIENLVDIITQNKNRQKLEEIQQLIISEINSNQNNSLIINNDLLILADDLLPHDLQIQQSFKERLTWLNKHLLIISAGNTIIAFMLALGNIIFSAAILICGLMLYYEINKIAIKVKEYELEISSAIDKINDTKDMMQTEKNVINEKRQKITQSIQQLNKFKIVNPVVDIASSLAIMFNNDVLIKVFLKFITPRIKDILLKTLNIDEDSILKNVGENLEEQYSNLKDITEYNFDRKLLYPYPVDNSFNLDFLLSVSSKVINLIQLLENKTMLLSNTLEKLKISRE